MTFIIRRNGTEVGKSESKVVSFSTPSEFKIGDIVPTATYTALNRNSFGDSPEVNVPSFEITNSDKPADTVASKITVTPGRTTAIIKDGTDRLTSTEDVLTAYDHDGKLVATSEGKTPEVQLKDLASSTTYQGYIIKWTNSHGSSSPALVPDFTTTSEPIEPISADKLTMEVGTTTNKIQYLGTEDRSGQIFHVAKSVSEVGQTANTAPWEVTLTDLEVNTKYPAETWVIYFSKASAKTDPVPLPEFNTLDIPAPVAPKAGDISVSNIEQTTAIVTDANSDSVDRSAEQIKVFLDTDAKEWTGKVGELTIALDGLTVNTNYNGRLTVGYYNPTTKKTSDKISVPNFSTKDYSNPIDPVASDLSVSDITDTTAKVTDGNSQGYDRTNEQIRVSKSGSTDDFRGVNGDFSITLDPLTPNTKYESNLWFHWYNPTTGKASGNVAVPTFTTEETIGIKPITFDASRVYNTLILSSFSIAANIDPAGDTPPVSGDIIEYKVGDGSPTLQKWEPSSNSIKLALDKNKYKPDGSNYPDPITIARVITDDGRVNGNVIERSAPVALPNLPMIYPPVDSRPFTNLPGFSTSKSRVDFIFQSNLMPDKASVNLVSVNLSSTPKAPFRYTLPETVDGKTNINLADTPYAENAKAGLYIPINIDSNHNYATGELQLSYTSKGGSPLGYRETSAVASSFVTGDGSEILRPNFDNLNFTLSDDKSTVTVTDRGIEDRSGSGLKATSQYVVYNNTANNAPIVQLSHGQSNPQAGNKTTTFSVSTSPNSYIIYYQNVKSTIGNQLIGFNVAITALLNSDTGTLKIVHKSSDEQPNTLPKPIS